MRSPPGSDADSSGDSASMRWRVEFATSFARRLTPLEVRKRQRHAVPSRARLDVRLAGPVDAQLRDFRSISIGRSARSVRSSAELSTAVGARLRDRPSRHGH